MGFVFCPLRENQYPDLLTGSAKTRTVEWLFVLSYLPAVIVPMLLRASAHGWAVAASLPALVAPGQIVGEGGRTQMVRLYLSAGLLLRTGAIALRNRRQILGIPWRRLTGVVTG